MVKLFLLSLQAMKRCAQKQNTGPSGFTLVEMSVVLVILSLLASVAFSLAAQNSRAERQRELTQKLNRIEQALIAYARQNNALPCPARPNSRPYMSFSAAYTTGSAVIDCGSATWNTTYSTRSSLQSQYDSTSSYIIAGTLPVFTLGLTDAEGIDPWGNQFTYAIDTTANAFRSLNGTFTAPFVYYNSGKNIGKIRINDLDGNAIVTNAIAVVVSHGENGNGAFPYQTTTATRKLSGTDSNEQKNCHCNNSGANTAFDGIFVQGSTGQSASAATKTFDDTVRYYLRTQFLVATDLPSQSQ